MLAIALLDPRRHRFDRVCERVGVNFVERRVLREPFEVSPRREDQPGFASPIPVQQ